MPAPLSVTPEVLRLGLGDDARLEQLLAAQELGTDLVPIGDVADLTMDAAGRLAIDGLQLTDWALSQICRLTYLGLYRLLEDMTTDGPDACAAAVSLFNQAVRLRFGHRLAGQSLLVDRQAGLVEAVVSPRFAHLSNLVLYRRVMEGVAATHGAAVLYDAVTTGRWLAARFFVRPALFTAAGDTYYGAYHVSGHEGGQGSLRVANGLARERGRLTLLTPFSRGRRVRHAGDKLEEKLTRTLDQALAFSHAPQHLAAQIEMLATQPLGLGTTLVAVEAQRRAELVKRLHRRRVPQGLAGRVVASAILQRYDERKPIPSVTVSKQRLGQITVLDLMTALSREAQRLPVSLRECLEQTAYATASGRLRFC